MNSAHRREMRSARERDYIAWEPDDTEPWPMPGAEIDTSPRHGDEINDQPTERTDMQIRNGGFTVIEALIGVVVIGIIIVVAYGATQGGNLSFGINGITETRCINGLQFVIGDGGQARQVLDDKGNGVRCGGAR